MEIFRFRVLVDQAEHVFRDIDIEANATFLDLHNAIMSAFTFSGMEMASFYLSNEDWDKGEEIALMDFNDHAQEEAIRTMEHTALKELVQNEGDKVLYLYDFLRMWIFFVEIIDVYITDVEEALPKVVLSVGDAPHEFDKAMVQQFPGSALDEDEDEYGAYGDDDYDADDLERLGGYEEDPHY